jgi:hypothetical protein
MGIVECHVSRWDAVTLSLNVYVPGGYMTDREDMGGVVKSIALLGKILAAAGGLAAHGYEVRNKIQTQHLRRFLIKC